MDGLIGCLDADKWQTIEDISKKGEGYKEFHLQRSHVENPKGTFAFLVDEADVDDGETKRAIVQFCKAGQDPLKSIGRCELRLVEKMEKENGEDKKVYYVNGIDLNDDVVELK